MYFTVPVVIEIFVFLDHLPLQRVNRHIRHTRSRPRYSLVFTALIMLAAFALTTRRETLKTIGVHRRGAVPRQFNGSDVA